MQIRERPSPSPLTEETRSSAFRVLLTAPPWVFILLSVCPCIFCNWKQVGRKQMRDQIPVWFLVPALQRRCRVPHTASHEDAHMVTGSEGLSGSVLREERAVFDQAG